MDGKYKKLWLDEPNEPVYDSRKLDNYYKKVLSNDLPDKNGNKLDGKYANTVTDMPFDEVYDKDGNKIFGMLRKVD